MKRSKPWQSHDRTGNAFDIVGECPSLDPPRVAHHRRTRRAADAIAGEMRRKGYRVQVKPK